MSDSRESVDKHPIRLFFSGISAIAFYLIHGYGYYACTLHEPAGMLWACHVGCLVVGVGCVAKKSLVVSVGALMLVSGSIVWAIDLASGSPLIPTSLGTHVGGLSCAAYGLFQLRFRRRASLYAIAFMIALLAFTRLATPRADNVNLAFAVPPGWEHAFPYFPAYFAFLFFTTALTYVAVDAILSRVFRSEAA